MGTIAMLPIGGVGRMVYYDGFCYADFGDAAISVPMFALTLLLAAAAATLHVRALASGRWPSQLDISLMLLALLSAWALWLPATFIGLAGAERAQFGSQAFPKNYMLMGGIMGRAQALISPLVYGLRWRASASRIGQP